MKIAVDNSMVAHLWANKSQAHAHSGNMSFDRDKIFSYSALIARFVEHDNREAVLIADRTWSNTTSSHQSDVRRSIHPDAVKFHVIDFGNDWRAPDHGQNMRHYLGKVETSLAKAAKARKYRESHLSAALNTADEANRYAEFFGLAERISGRDMDEVRVQRDALNVAERERDRIAYAAHVAKTEATLKAWQDGETDSRDGLSMLHTAYFRVKGDTVQTSKGAEFPVSHASRAWAAVQSCRANGTAWERNGQLIRMGLFQIDRIDAEGNVKAGCHSVEYAEVARLASLLGLS